VTQHQGKLVDRLDGGRCAVDDFLPVDHPGQFYPDGFGKSGQVDGEGVSAGCGVPARDVGADDWAAPGGGHVLPETFDRVELGGQLQRAGIFAHVVVTCHPLV
jgi:hypothetical protein